MTTVSDYKSLDTTYKTNCRCNLWIEWEAPFTIPLAKLEKLVYNKFKWTLFPSRCPKCKGAITKYGED